MNELLTDEGPTCYRGRMGVRRREREQNSIGAAVLYRLHNTARRFSENGETYSQK